MEGHLKSCQFSSLKYTFFNIFVVSIPSRVFFVAVKLSQKKNHTYTDL